MASLLLLSGVTNSATLPELGKDAIFVATMPLRAKKGPPQLLMSAAYSLNKWDVKHFMVIVKPSSPPQSQAIVFDFQPRDPEDANVALAALLGREVPGVVLTRKLKQLPRNKCWLVGSCDGNAIDIAYKFNDSWQTGLRIGHHDCRDYTNGLVEYLTGEKCVLERLKRSSLI
ncbi:hypothetical protein RJ641_017188 [Dillenia turbinata]|uniref:Uncharacterized protein n=1 Tax=Dillenia turbinata TaxID=194707 RepID=A0AAN8YZD8_9MAGN